MLGLRYVSGVIFDFSVVAIQLTLKLCNIVTIIENLKTYIEGRTLIVVTHRNSLLALADRILVVDSGKVVADGKRDAVIAALREGKIGRADA